MTHILIFFINLFEFIFLYQFILKSYELKMQHLLLQVSLLANHFWPSLHLSLSESIVKPGKGENADVATVY